VSTAEGGEGDGEWSPFPIFSTDGRPIFVGATVIHIAAIGRFAISFGTGDLEDLFGEQAAPGRYYTIVDEGLTAATPGLPLTEADYRRVAGDDGAAIADLLIAPPSTQRPGWVLELDANEKLVSRATAISGLLSFTTFVSDGAHGQEASASPGGMGGGCFDVSGHGRVYRLLATNADPLTGAERHLTQNGFAGEPFVVTSGFTEQSALPSGAIDPFAGPELARVRETLMSLFPPGCRFGNYRLRVGVSGSGGQQVPVAEVPQCVRVRNWKEF
jgi:hypothetical protein